LDRLSAFFFGLNQFFVTGHDLFQFRSQFQQVCIGSAQGCFAPIQEALALLQHVENFSWAAGCRPLDVGLYARRKRVILGRGGVGWRLAGRTERGRADNPDQDKADT
jgi:hypothetical protein